jgi:hypothetical protein
VEEALLTAEFFLAGLASDEELLDEESESLSTTFYFLDLLFLLESAEALELALALLAGTLGASLELLLLELLELSSELSEASAASLAASSASFAAAAALALASAFFDFLSFYKWSMIVQSETKLGLRCVRHPRKMFNCTKNSLSKVLHVFLRKNGL